MMSSDCISIFEPMGMTAPLFKVTALPLSDKDNRYAVRIWMSQDGQPFDKSTTVTFFVSLSLDVLRYYFPTLEVEEQLTSR